MLFTFLDAPKTSREVFGAFRGLDRRPSADPATFVEMTNMSGDAYPLLSQRKRRGVVTTLADPQGLVAKEALLWVDGDSLYMNALRVQGLTLSTEPEMCPKQMVSMGAYLCIFPDGKWVNTADTSEYGSMGASYTVPDGQTVTYRMCTAEGGDFEGVLVAGTAPENPEGGAYWIDTSESPHVLKRYAADTSAWVPIATTYVRISAPGIGRNFREGDGVRLSGCAVAGDNAALTVQVEALCGAHVLVRCDEDAIVIAGILDGVCTQVVTDESAVSAARVVPSMDFVTECGNRLWGCKYGVVDGVPVNELYCCKLGDFTNWEVYEGIASDAWRASVGSDGAFTGAATYGGCPVFFKEDRFHKVFPSATGAHRVVETAGRGIRKGCGRSAVIVDEVLYYVSRGGVCAYDGSLPVSVSDAMCGSHGDFQLADAVGGGFGGKYYLSGCEDGAYSLYVYDTRRGFWHREDGTRALGFAACHGDLYHIDADSGELVSVNGSEGTREAPLQWEATSAVQGFYTGKNALPDKKYLSRYDLRMALDAGATVQLSVQYDSSGVWEAIGAPISGVGKLRTFVVPVRPRRCDHLQLRLAGTGRCDLYSIARILEEGSDA